MTKAYNDQRYESFHQEGLIYGLMQAVLEGCRTSDDNCSRFQEPRLNRRVRSSDRSACVDNALLQTAPLFGFQQHWPKFNSSGFPDLPMITRDNLIISAHQVKRERDAADFAIHRNDMMPVYPRPLIYTLEQIIKITRQEFSIDGPIEYWMLVYERTKSRMPHWITLGRPVQGQRQLAYAKSVTATLGVIHEDEEINLNPGIEQQVRNFTLPGVPKPEGEGE